MTPSATLARERRSGASTLAGHKLRADAMGRDEPGARRPYRFLTSLANFTLCRASTVKR